MFFIPFFRELWYATQACAATKAGMEYLLTQPGGQLVVLVPGGAQESLNCDKGEVRLILKQRKGFIKLAIRCGVNLVPCFTFGENSIYDKVYKLIINNKKSVILTFSCLIQRDLLSEKFKTRSRMCLDLPQ